MIGDIEVNERQQWILDQLRKGGQLQRANVEQQFDCSAKTAKRDLANLRKRGLVEFIQEPWPGHYHLKSPQDQADSCTISAK